MTNILLGQLLIIVLESDITLGVMHEWKRPNKPSGHDSTHYGLAAALSNKYLPELPQVIFVGAIHTSAP